MYTIKYLKDEIISLEKKCIEDYVKNMNTKIYEANYIGFHNINVMARISAQCIKEIIKKEKISNIKICKVVFCKMREFNKKMTYMRIDFQGEK